MWDSKGIEVKGKPMLEVIDLLNNQITQWQKFATENYNR
jgi:hypothetical protein